jgi:response regulator RpfG family c-di-GMP phosphodiesterase
MDRQEAKDIIVTSAGIHFDPILVEAFKLLEDQFHQLRIELVDTSLPGQCSTDI